MARWRRRSDGFELVEPQHNGYEREDPMTRTSRRLFIYSLFGNEFKQGRSNII